MIFIRKEELEGFDNIVAKQDKSQWCWAACIEMILKYNRGRKNPINVEQEDIVRRTYGIDPYTNEEINWPGTHQAITNNLNNYGFQDRDGEIYGVQAEFFSTYPNFQELVNSVRLNIPIMIGTRGHAMVVTGIFYTHNFLGQPFIDSIEIFDPWPSHGKVVYNANKFMKEIVTHWNVDTFQEENIELDMTPPDRIELSYYEPPPVSRRRRHHGGTFVIEYPYYPPRVKWKNKPRRKKIRDLILGSIFATVLILCVVIPVLVIMNIMSS